MRCAGFGHGVSGRKLFYLVSPFFIRNGLKWGSQIASVRKCAELAGDLSSRFTIYFLKLELLKAYVKNECMATAASVGIGLVSRVQ